MTEVVMPRLSDSMEEGTILRWLKREGDAVYQGDPLAEIETDKATITYEADANGILRILAQEGETVPIGRPIARIREAGEVEAGEVGEVEAAEAGEAAPAAHVPAAPAPAATGAVGTGKGRVRVEQPTRVQVQIAQRMAESKATIPDFTLHTEVDMDQAVAWRGGLEDADGSDAVTPSYNDMVVKACAIALREHPRANGAYRDGAFEMYERVNVGIAVAAQDSLIVPTIFDADRKSLRAIAREALSLAERVREGNITPPELSGGTFTVSNLGMFGVRSFAAIINPPQAAILSVGALREEPVVRDGRVVPGRRMDIALTCDHRILYGAPAAEFLARVRELLEQPALALWGRPAQEKA